MTNDDWVKIAAGFASGGVLGSLITNLWTEWRNRVQPVGYRVENDRIFSSKPGLSTLYARVAVLHNDDAYNFDNLSISQLEIINRGNKDLNAFSFGITLSNYNAVIFTEAEGQDRHHTATPVQNATPDNPLNRMDFTCQPFHRGNSYRVKLYIVSPEGEMRTPEIALSSPDPIRFVEAPSMGELLREAIFSASLSIGPIRVSIR